MRIVRSVRATCGFLIALAFALVTASPAAAAACEMANFLLDGDQNALTGEKITFTLGLRPSHAFFEAAASATVAWGDGTVERTVPTTIRMGIVSSTRLTVEHTYQKPGTYVAAIRGATLDGETCTFGSWFFPAQVTVAENPLHARTVHPISTPGSPALDRKSQAAFPAPTPVPLKGLVVSETGTSNSALASALLRGQIARVSVQGNVLRVEGSGRCALKVFEEFNGRPLRTDDYKGALPASIALASTPVGLHSLRVEGDKASTEACDGKASATYSIAR